MRRRAVLFLLAGAGAALPRTTEAQQLPMAFIGFLNSGSPKQFAHMVSEFRKGLKETGFVEGENLKIEYRWAENKYERLPALAAELIQQGVAVLAATGGPVAALAAKQATSTVPVVFGAVADPVQSGLVKSLGRPGGNLTGIAGLTAELDPKRFELLRELVPAATTFGALVNPNRPGVNAQVRVIEDAAQSFRVQLVILRAGHEQDLENTLAELSSRKLDALLVSADPFFNSRREQILAWVARSAVPAIYQWREFALAGGLMSYGPSLADAYRQAGVYTGRILKGEQPADLPVVQPTKFELVINVHAAKAIGLDIPPTLLARADEVIE